MTIIDQLIGNLSRIPGVGKKSAARMVYFFLQSESRYLQNLAGQLKDLKQIIKNCRACGNYTEQDLCALCLDPKRKAGLICVVEQPHDIQPLEATGEFNGRYHVLRGLLNPLEGIGPQDINLDSLLERLNKELVNEVIIATSPTAEGDTTALYIAKLLREKGVKTSRLAYGLPVGGDLEYADRLTLARSLRGRVDV